MSSTPRHIGVNTWVWTSPLTDEALRSIAPQVKEWGFDVIELPVENIGDWDPAAAARLLTDLGLGATVTLVMGEGRELVAADAATVTRTQDYLCGVVDAAHTVGVPSLPGRPTPQSDAPGGWTRPTGAAAMRISRRTWAPWSTTLSRPASRWPWSR